MRHATGNAGEVRRLAAAKDRLHISCISVAPRLHLGCISAAFRAASRLHLDCIAACLRRLLARLNQLRQEGHRRRVDLGQHPVLNDVVRLLQRHLLVGRRIEQLRLVDLSHAQQSVSSASSLLQALERKRLRHGRPHRPCCVDEQRVVLERELGWKGACATGKSRFVGREGTRRGWGSELFLRYTSVISSLQRVR